MGLCLFLSLFWFKQYKVVKLLKVSSESLSPVA